MAITNNHFRQAEKSWDLTKLYKDLAQMKGKPLTEIEKLHLRGLLCGYSPAEIANKRGLKNRGIEANFCNTLYQYVKKLVNKCDHKLDNYEQVVRWLEEVGYKIESPHDFNNEDAFSLEINSLDVNVKVRKAQINLKQNKVFVDINIRLVAPIEDDILEEEIMTDHLEENFNENGYIFNNDQVEEYNN